MESAQLESAQEQCLPCRGTGRVISNLGGAPSQVECPWCGGHGVRQREVDAQAHWAAQQDGGGAPAQDGGGESP